MKNKKIILAALLVIATGFGKSKLIESDLSTETLSNYEIVSENIDFEEKNNRTYKFYGSELSRQILMSNIKNDDKLIGNTNKEKIENYLRNEEYNEAAICGIMACMYQASHYNPETIGDGGCALGIIQWNKERMDRLIEPSYIYLEEHLNMSSYIKMDLQMDL